MRGDNGEGLRRGGFTLVELLVVITIIGILVSLLLPAVQAAREAGRRTDCENNLKQIGLALHLYHDVYEKFPPGWLLASNADTSGGSSWAWSVFILPFMEQTALYDNLRVDNPQAIVPLPGDPRDLLRPLYVCPSDAGPERIEWFRKYAKSNYPGVNGTGADTDGDGIPDGRVAAGFQDPNANGIFGLATGIGFHAVTDGTSNTFAVGERKSDKNVGAIWMRAIGHSASGSGLPGMPRSNANSDVVPEAVAGVCNAFKRLNLPNPVFIAPLSDNSDSVGNFGSLHPGGAQFLLCDGSVQFIAAAIELATYQNLANRRDGKVLGDF